MKKFLLIIALLPLLSFFQSCSDSDDEPMRFETDILGVWTDSADHYIMVRPDYRAYELTVGEKEGYPIGFWNLDGFFYEPGYELVVIIRNDSQADVYKVVSLTNDQLVICWVESVIDKHNAGMSAGEIIADILKNAQEGYKLNPTLFEYYKRISTDRFFEILDELQLIFPWDIEEVRG